MRNSWKTKRRVAIAKIKSGWKRLPLPPGDFVTIDPLQASDRKVLITKAGNGCSIFTTVWGDRVHICVLNLATARRLLAQHREDLNSISIDLKSIVPKGFLRTMEGEDHKTYRKLFSRAMAGSVAPSAVTDVCVIIGQGVTGMLDGGTETAVQRVLEQIALRVLIRTLLGVRPHTAAFEEIEQQFRAMGPDGFVWKIGPSQRAAFKIIYNRLFALITDANGEIGIDSNSVLGRLVNGDLIDSTTIGNLIYMVEMGRSDFQSLFSWIVRFIGDDPSILRQAFSSQPPTSGVSRTQAIVLEALRMEQSIALMRSAKRDFVFDGLLIPKGAAVRICLWEIHKAASTFEDALTFNSDRFLQREFSADQFAPFGLGHHRCPAAEFTTQIASLFVKAYARAKCV
ncbi:cytochrome P450 [Mesorhizobium sp. 10J20-29]